MCWRKAAELYYYEINTVVPLEKMKTHFCDDGEYMDRELPDDFIPPEKREATTNPSPTPNPSTQSSQPMYLELKPNPKP